jgi:glyceraldehyde 3-phosphate dehydrogenase
MMMAVCDDERLWSEWHDRLEVAEQMIPIIGRLSRHNGVVTSLYGRRLVNRSAIDIVKAHRFARHIDGKPLSEARSLAVLKALARSAAGPASVDIAQLLADFESVEGEELNRFVADEMAKVSAADDLPATDVVLYGFGRIGRLIARILVSHHSRGSGLRLRAIVVRDAVGVGDLVKRASLLRRDSVHGPFDGTIFADEENSAIIANGTRIHVIRAASPGEIDYTAYGIDEAIVVDNTGRRRAHAELSEHLACPGVARVLLTAPGKGPVPNIVHGINEHESAGQPVVAAASCTTNAVAPVLKALSDRFGIVRGHVETVHSFTNDQNLTDNFHKANRRGRAAPLNMVIAETGAAEAVAKAVPELSGKLTGNAIRVPTPDVSLAILNLRLQTPASRETLNGYLRETSLSSDLRSQVDYVESPEFVSSDVLGSRFAGVVDGLATIADGEEDVVVYVWYDNEFGYSYQVVRVLEFMSGTHPASVPARPPRAVQA